MTPLKRALLAVMVSALVGLACGAMAPAATATPEPTQTNAPTSTPAATATPRLTSTPRPTSTAVGEAYAWNDLATLESGGLTVRIARVVLADKTAITDVPLDQLPSLENTPVVMTLFFVITNNTDEVINIHPDQGTLVAGSEQVELLDHFFNTFGDETGGEIFPGVTKIGGLWLGFQRTTVAEVQHVTLTISAPYDNDFNTLGSDLTFDLDLSQRQHDPLPAELEHLR